ncbi:MAG: ABC transporter permease subunit [Bacillota bacterium]|nr:ABC transporter permease subunit [Bacillota bacterium]
MMIFRHELKRGRLAFIIWTAAIAFMLFICMILYPEMEGEMSQVGETFSNMGSFSDAFGMDQLNFGEVMGFYGIECGNVLGIGGGFFAALLGIGMLSKEEKERTAEFLLSHPVSRISVIGQKLAAVLFQLILMNVIIVGVAALSFAVIGEDMEAKEFLLLHLAFTVVQLEIACLCFGISAFLRRGGLGIGLGLAAVLYFLNLIANISEEAEPLRYVTPFAYAEASDIIGNSEIDMTLMGLGVLYALVGVAAAFLKYTRKDIAA